MFLFISRHFIILAFTFSSMIHSWSPLSSQNSEGISTLRAEDLTSGFRGNWGLSPLRSSVHLRTTSSGTSVMWCLIRCLWNGVECSPGECRVIIWPFQDCTSICKMGIRKPVIQGSHQHGVESGCKEALSKVWPMEALAAVVAVLPQCYLNATQMAWPGFL